MVAAPILDDCRRELCQFGKPCIDYCNRESNVVAHVLAEWGRENQASVWFESPPDFIINFLTDDIAVI